MIREGSVKNRRLGDGNIRSDEEKIKDGSGSRGVSSWNRYGLGERM